MKKIVILGLFFNFILVHGQDKVVTKNGKEIEVNKDATTTSKGVVKLAGDLGGTADLPTVPGLASKQNLLINPVTGTGTINYLSKFSGTSTLSNSLLFDNGTNIGIGTTAPGARFHIEGATVGSSGASGSGSLMWLKQTTTWGLTAPYALWVDGYSYLNGFRISGTDGQRAIYNQIANTELGFGTNGGDITFSSNNGLTRRVYILNSNGNMGIGTATPSSKLEISTGSAGSSGLRFTNLTNTTSGTAAFSGILGVNSSGDVGIGTIASSTLSGLTSGQVTFGGTTGNLAQSSSLFWDQTNNRLGIGTSSPSTNLHISSLTATNTVNADAQVLRLSRPTNNGVKWDNIAQFNLGSYSLGGSAFSRMDLAMNDGGSTTTSNVMTWQANGNVGIGSTAPGSKLEIVQNSLLTGTETSTHGLQIVSGKTANTDFTLYMGADKTNGLSYLQSVKWGATTAPLVFNGRGGNVGIGTTNPISRLEVNGAATNTAAFNSGSATAILFMNSNLAYTSASASAFNLQGMKDGGTYTLAVQGGTSGTSSFSGLNPSNVAFTFKLINNGPTTASKHTLYTFLVMGTTVYVYMATGF